MLRSAVSICLISVWKKPHDLRWFRLHEICALKCMLSLLYTKWTLFPNTFGNVPGFPGFCPERSFRRLFSSRITTFQAPRHTIFEETKPISSLQFTYKQKKNVLELEWMTSEKKSVYLNSVRHFDLVVICLSRWRTLRDCYCYVLPHLRTFKLFFLFALRDDLPRPFYPLIFEGFIQILKRNYL